MKYKFGDKIMSYSEVMEIISDIEAQKTPVKCYRFYKFQMEYGSKSQIGTPVEDIGDANMVEIYKIGKELTLEMTIEIVNN